MKRLFICGGLAALLCALPAHAWSPQTRAAIVSSASFILNKNTNIPLRERAEDLRLGAMLPDDNLAKLFLDYQNDPIGAITVEMQVLKAVNGQVDRYYAYRLGALGRLVADYTAPMRGAPGAYQNLYYADVDRHLGNLPMDIPKLQLVEPGAYFPGLLRQAAVNDAMIQQDYRNGTGLSAFVAAQLGKDIQRSATAVAEVWNTVFSRSALPGNVSNAQLERYAMDAYAYYIHEGFAKELSSVAARLDALTPPTAEMRAQLGDLYIEAKEPDKAMAAYKEAVSLDPSRKDVVEKVSAYYAASGKLALDAKRLDDALAAYDTALQHNPGDLAAETGRLNTTRQIEVREERIAGDRDILNQAAQYEDMAEQEATDGRFAEAISLLHQAAAEYGRVNPESVTEHQRAKTAIERIGVRVQDLKQGIMANVQQYGGKGFALDAHVFSAAPTKDIDTQALQRILSAEYEKQMKALEEQLARKLEITAR